VEFLLDKGADVNHKNYNGNTPLHIAIVNQDLEVCKVLISRGADVSITNNEGKTPLQVAIGRKFNNKLKDLIPEP
jgi:ankyrin repeat protein